MTKQVSKSNVKDAFKAIEELREEGELMSCICAARNDESTVISITGKGVELLELVTSVLLGTLNNVAEDSKQYRDFKDTFMSILLKSEYKGGNK